MLRHRDQDVTFWLCDPYNHTRVNHATFSSNLFSRSKCQWLRSIVQHECAPYPSRCPKGLSGSTPCIASLPLTSLSIAMAPRPSSSSRVVFDLLRPSRSNASCDHLRFRKSFCKPGRQVRHVSTTGSRSLEMEVDSDNPPRWSQTPPGLKAPVRIRPARIAQPLKINKDQRKLDAFYTGFLGRGGDKMLSEETKWLAVTNKSFDAGRRGFNDRLAFFGQFMPLSRLLAMH